jgi:hypothetical protein
MRLHSYDLRPDASDVSALGRSQSGFGSPSRDDLPWRLAVFQPQWRSTVGALARGSPVLADLIESFPALLFALATGYGDCRARDCAIERLNAGASLSLSAEALGLPLWTRKIPAAALTDPFPALPIDSDFCRRMANLVPHDVTQCAQWLQLVNEALLAGGRQYVLWAARHGVALTGTLSEHQQRLLHAWVWMAWHPGTFGHALIRRPWSPDLGIKRVMDEYGVFVQRLCLADALGPGHGKLFVADATVHGLSFEMLQSAFAFIQAADSLDNCLEQYGERLRRGTCAVAVIRDAGQPVACVEIGPHPAEASMPTIVQLRMAKNKRASAPLWRAAYAWLSSCDACPLTCDTFMPTVADRLDTRHRLWGGYLADLAAHAGGRPIADRARHALMTTPCYAEMYGGGLRAPRLAPYRLRPLLDNDAPLLQRLANLLPRSVAHRTNRDP